MLDASNLVALPPDLKGSGCLSGSTLKGAGDVAETVAVCGVTRCAGRVLSSETVMNDDDDVVPLLEEFRLKAEPLGVTVGRVSGTTEAVAVLADWVSSLGASAVIVSCEAANRAPGLVAGLSATGVLMMPSASPHETRDSPVGLSLAHLAIAETGSMLLSEPSLADRSVGMLTLAQAIVCPTSALVPTLDEAVPLLREIAMRPGGSFTTLVTGPSRTADIERVLTVGVQGPGVVMTLFVDDL